MRSIYLVVAAAALVVCVFAHAWAGWSREGESVSIGVRDVVHCDHEDCYTHDLDDHYGVDTTGEHESTACTWLLAAAALSLLIAAGMVKNGPIELAPRIAFAVPCAAAAFATILFASRVTRPHLLHIGWAPIVAVGALAIGLCAIFVQQPPPES